MDTKAQTKYLHTSPRKVRLVVDVVRGLGVDEALNRLRLLDKKASRPVAKLLAAASANAEHNFELERGNLYVKEIKVDEAPTLKRWMPRAHGRATTIRKRMSNISVTLGEIKDSGQKSGRRQAAEAPVKLGTALKEKPRTAQMKPELHEHNEPDAAEEKGKEINDPRREGRHGHGRLEGGRKGFVSKMFRRKSG